MLRRAALRLAPQALAAGRAQAGRAAWAGGAAPHAPACCCAACAAPASARFSALAAPTGTEVPDGHKESDLSPPACNVGLGRRRDLTLRADVRLHGRQAAGQSLASLFKGVRAVVFGVPDMGKVCSATHVPSYLEQAGALKKAGVDRIICVGSGDPEAVLAWATSLGADGSTGVAALADRDGAFARMLGVEAPAGAPYATHRYAALVEDGILLKLKVEKAPGDCVNTRGEELLACARDFFVA